MTDPTPRPEPTLADLSISQRGALTALVASGRVHMPYVSTYATADLNKLVQLGLAQVLSRSAFAQVFQPTPLGRRLVGAPADDPASDADAAPPSRPDTIAANPGARLDRPFGVVRGVKDPTDKAAKLRG